MWSVIVLILKKAVDLFKKFWPSITQYFASRRKKREERRTRLKAENIALKKENIALKKEIEKLATPDDMIRSVHCLFKKMGNGSISTVPYCLKCRIPFSGNNHRYNTCACGFPLTETAYYESISIIKDSGLDVYHFSK